MSVCHWHVAACTVGCNQPGWDIAKPIVPFALERQGTLSLVNTDADILCGRHGNPDRKALCSPRLSWQRAILWRTYRTMPQMDLA